MLCRVPGLEAWLSRHSIDGAFQANRLTVSVAERRDEAIPVHELGGDVVLRTGSKNSVGAHAVSIKTHGYICLRPREPLQLKWYFEQLPKVTSLLTLLAGSQMSVDQIALPTSIGTNRLSVLIRQFGDQKYCPFTQEHEFFLPRSALKDCFAQVLSNWFARYPGVQSACGLALSVINSDDLRPHVEFLSLMQALEGFHRALYAGTYEDAGEYEKVRDALLKAIPASVSKAHRDALGSKIRYGNEYSLRKRVNMLLDRLSASLRKNIIGGEGNAPGAWIDTRNYYTHWDEALRPDILDTKGMHYAGLRLKLVLRVLYLQLAGVPEDAFMWALKNPSKVSLDIQRLNATPE